MDAQVDNQSVHAYVACAQTHTIFKSHTEVRKHTQFLKATQSNNRTDQQVFSILIVLHNINN